MAEGTNGEAAVPSRLTMAEAREGGMPSSSDEGEAGVRWGIGIEIEKGEGRRENKMKFLGRPCE